MVNDSGFVHETVCIINACIDACMYTVRQKKGTNFLLCASLLILDRNW